MRIFKNSRSYINMKIYFTSLYKAKKNKITYITKNISKKTIINVLTEVFKNEIHYFIFI